MYYEKDDEQKTAEKPSVPLECPPREKQTITEPIKDIKEKIEF